MFMVNGANNVVRVNGTAILATEAEVTRTFEHNQKVPKSVIVVTVNEIYFQCAKALMRSKLWQSGDSNAGLPTAGDFLKEVSAEFDGKSYDEGYPEYAKTRMW